MTDGEPVRRLIVSLHDVAPPFEGEIAWQMDALRRVGVDRLVLKVVPDWAAHHPLPEATSLVALLTSAHESACELVLHGLHHRGTEPLRGPALLRLRARLFAPQASEFARLTPAAAREAVEQGLALFAEAGLPAPAGFCPPGWLLAPDLRPALRDAGIRYLVSMFTVEELSTGAIWRVAATGHMGAGALHEEGARLQGALARRLTPDIAAIKLYLHPQRARDSRRVRQVISLAQRLVADGWRPTTYAELCLPRVHEVAT
jgi:uncharacterized protein